MADSKIEIKVGNVSFSGEGDGKWLSEQLDKILEKIPQLAEVAPTRFGSDGGDGTEAGESGKVTTKKPSATLASYLKEKKTATNQTRKFLATAVWLHDQGHEHLTTKEVTKALSDKKQGSLTNPSNCLAQNVSKGFCEKVGKRQFYVTDDGRTSLG